MSHTAVDVQICVFLCFPGRNYDCLLTKAELSLTGEIRRKAWDNKSCYDFLTMHKIWLKPLHKTLNKENVDELNVENLLLAEQMLHISPS